MNTEKISQKFVTGNGMNVLYDQLYALAINLRRSSSVLANELWGYVAPKLWSTTRNPWIIVQTISRDRCEELAEDEVFRKILSNHLEHWDNIRPTSKWCQMEDISIAYFSMEFGLSEALPIYSGGLGILAGDHLKACHDLGVPLVGIGLLYQQGYFRQEISSEGKQLSLLPYNEPAQLPIEKLPIRLELKLPGRALHVRVFKAIVGSISLYLLDTNDLTNSPADRTITGELYGGGSTTRLKQEMVLGIGGVRLLQALGINVDVYHLNEGHAAFAIIERAHALMKNHPFKEAFQLAKKRVLFTTHTPVEAGFDRFSIDLISQHFSEYVERELAIPMEDFLSLGQLKRGDPFNMAYLAINGSAYVNGVSRLHGTISQKLFAPLGVEVGHVTNGIHIPTWESSESDSLWERHCGENRWRGTLEILTQRIQKIPYQELWDFRNQNRQKLIDYTRRCIEFNLRSMGKKAARETPLKPHILTVGFARRFTSYKRVDLLLQEPSRLTKLLRKNKIQLIIAGKAHPQDRPGQYLIEKWTTFVNLPEVRAYAIFLPDYDMFLAEHLVQGIDLWINTPRPPLEASGTSGMKLLANGGLNLSVLDGWWKEAYSEQVGWAIQGEDDKTDANQLYTLLEEEIIPTFYERDKNNLPVRWLKKVKESMARLTPQYSANRMVREYFEKYYKVIARG